jgi:hypothetical protein
MGHTPETKRAKRALRQRIRVTGRDSENTTDNAKNDERLKKNFDFLHNQTRVRHHETG